MSDEKNLQALFIFIRPSSVDRRVFESLDGQAYFPCLKQHHLKLTCAGVSSLFWTVRMRIDSQGSLTQHIVTESSKPALEPQTRLQECVIEYFRARPFPEALRNRWIEVRLGTGLTC